MAPDKYSDQSKSPGDWKKSVIVYLHDLLYMLMAILLVFLLFFRIIVVSGDSMYSTLLDGDYLLLLGNLFYSEPEHGDIVVISKKAFDNGKPIVKRVIGVPLLSICLFPQDCRSLRRMHFALARFCVIFRFLQSRYFRSFTIILKAFIRATFFFPC